MPQDIFALSLTELAAAYRRETLSALEVTTAYLNKLRPGPVYRVVTAERALRQAKRADEQFKKRIYLGPLQGIPIALKDLIDTAGEVTAAGSPVLAQRSAAQQDAPIVARLDAAGAVFLGKTNMTELAFSGIGINPHYGTPGNALDPSRIPGGSSSGSAVAVASGLACAAIGSDTGGSVRIPASFNGLIGLKTTDGDIPTEGCVPLSTTLDTIGPLSKTVEDCWHLWRAMRALPPAKFEPRAVKGLKLLIPQTVLLEGLEPAVAAAFTQSCERLTELGAAIEYRDAPVLQEILDSYASYGNFAGMESLALYEDILEQQGGLVDPRVSARILQQQDRRASDYIRLQYARARLQSKFWTNFGNFDAVLAPTVAILPPKTLDLQEDEAYFRTNGLCLRNTMIFNFLAVPALSVPAATTPEGLSIGLMIAGKPHEEYLLLSLARALEKLT